MLEDKNNFTEIDLEVRNEIYHLLEKLGMDSNILSAVSSWKETLPSKDVLSMLVTYSKDVLNVTDNS